MKELSEELYLSRRDFVKALGLGATVLATGCLEPIENYFKQREREKRRIKPEELEKLSRVNVLYFDGRERELYSTDHPYKYYDDNGYQVFFDGDYIVFDPPVKHKKFSSMVVISGEHMYAGKEWLVWTETDKKIFRSNVKHLLKVLHEYSPEWYEKTMYAGEVIEPSGITSASPSGEISLSGEIVTKYVIKYIRQNDIKKLLVTISALPHEVQHIIDLNVYKPFFYELRGLESELRAGIAGSDYVVKVGLWSEREMYDGVLYSFKERLPSELKVDTEKYKDGINELDKRYFDHDNKKLKMDFLNESWQQFRNKYF